jgi:hypothetical protein
MESDKQAAKRPVNCGKHVERPKCEGERRLSVEDTRGGSEGAATCMSMSWRKIIDGVMNGTDRKRGDRFYE